jgi:uncharacterized protein YjbI with pentapeptide repeats
MYLGSRLAAVVIGVLGALALIFGYLYLHGATLTHLVPDLYANLGVDFVGTAITVLVIDYLNERRAESELKGQLKRDLGSESNLLAMRAIRELKAHQNSKGGWLRDGTLQGVSLLGADLSNASLEGADLSGADVTAGKLQGAFLSEAKLQNAVLRFADLSHAKLEAADLGNVDLTGARLEAADLREANLSGAKLHRTNLRAADLRRANLTEVNLDRIQFDDKTQWPEGFDPGSLQ